MYGELIIGLNMMFNFTILSFANHLQNVHIHLFRLLFASFIGAALIVLLWNNIFTIFIVFVCMTIIAFGTNIRRWQALATTSFLAALFAGGFLTAIHQQMLNTMQPRLLLFYCVVTYGVLHLVKRKVQSVQSSERIASLSLQTTLYLWEATIPLNVFVDSGNTCEEPLSQKPVHFLSYQAVERYMPKSFKELLLTWKPGQPLNIDSIPSSLQKHIRLIKIYTLQNHQWAIGIRYQQWIVEEGMRLPEGYIVFIVDHHQFPNDTEGILHGSVLEKIDKRSE